MRFVQVKGINGKIPVGKIVCIGRNYAEHAREMQSAVPATPIFFLKPSTAIVHDGGEIVLPPISNDVHHEVELTVLIGKEGRSIPANSAKEFVAGYGVGLDMTMRDVQDDAKKKGNPWSLAKGFDTSAPLSEFVPVENVPDPLALSLRLSVNGSVRQQAGTSNMIFSVDNLIAYISRFITLEQGDVLFTGTPQGVARVVSGDVLVATLSDASGTTQASLSVHVR
ncbi:MAG TPA: fumarylacetoacetate hydrolase family protein [Bacteroidota bacterium]